MARFSPNYPTMGLDFRAEAVLWETFLWEVLPLRRPTPVYRVRRRRWAVLRQLRAAAVRSASGRGRPSRALAADATCAWQGACEAVRREAREPAQLRVGPRPRPRKRRRRGRRWRWPALDARSDAPRGWRSPPRAGWARRRHSGLRPGRLLRRWPPSRAPSPRTP